MIADLSHGAPVVPFPARRVLLGVTGSIAAADTPAIVLALRQMCGIEIRAVMSTAASSFVTPKALAVATGHRVVTEESFRAATPDVDHVELTRWADLVLILPATADVLGKAAHGLAPDALTTCVLAAGCPVVFVPSMNSTMWGKPAVQRNVETLRADGYGVIPPAKGFSIANGTVQEGAMPLLPDILAWIVRWPGAADLPVTEPTAMAASRGR